MFRPPWVREKFNVLMCWLMLKAWVTEVSLSIVTFETAAPSGVLDEEGLPVGDGGRRGRNRGPRSLEKIRR